MEVNPAEVASEKIILIADHSSSSTLFISLNIVLPFPLISVYQMYKPLHLVEHVWKQNLALTRYLERFLNF